MKEEFEKLVAAGKVNAGDVDTLVQLASEGFCMHKSWGFGAVKTVDVVLGKMTVDFSDRLGHVIDLAFAPKILAPIAKSHIEARKATDMKELKAMAGSDHHGVIKVIIDSYGNLATADKVQSVLVPEVIDKDDFKKWWETARKEMKKDGHFVLPTKKSEPLEYQAQDIPLQERLLQEFNSARGLKARLVLAAEIAKSARELDDAAAMAEAALGKLNGEIASHARTKPGLALEAAMVRDDLAAALGAEVSAEAPGAEIVWAAAPRLAELVNGMAMARQGRALESYQAHHEGWPEVFLGLINQVPARLVGECVGLLSAGGKQDALQAELGQLVNHHSASGELLLWLAKDKSGDFADTLTPETFGAMLSAIERETSDLKRASKLRDFLLKDEGILDQLTAGADLEVVKDIIRAIQMSTCFEGMDKRSVLGKFVKAYPEIQEFITHGDKDKEAQFVDTGLIVSWDSLARRKEKLEDLVTLKIPANSKDLEIAREYGDLRENAEFKAAKEHQKVLMTQRADLENEIENARAINYNDASTEVANVGTCVMVTNLDTGIREEIALLGAWDGDPDHNRISYLTPMGQAIIGRTPGEEVEVQLGDQSRRLRVESIASFVADTPEQAPA
jgi:transcription elongation GreA/GreB family factor